MFNAGSYTITIAHTDDFDIDSGKYLKPEEFNRLCDFLSKYPDAGEPVSDCGGVRLVRWKAQSQGKDGRVTVIYFFRDLNVPVYLLSILPRAEKLELTSEDKAMVTKQVSEIVAVTVAKRYKVFSLA